jgi:hypothetical protein
MSNLSKAIDSVAIQMAALEIAFEALLMAVSTTQPSLASRLLKTLEAFQESDQFRNKLLGSEVRQKLSGYTEILRTVSGANPQ